LLVGDANDWQEFDGPLTSQYWTGLWEGVRQSYLVSGFPAGGQPSLDVIPTFYKVDNALPPGDNMSRYTPYYATDQPYADTNGDGRMDVVVTRWPVSSAAHVQGMVNKLLAYEYWWNSYWTVSDVWVYDWSNASGSASGKVIRAVAAELTSQLATWSHPGGGLAAFPIAGESGLVGYSVGGWNYLQPDVLTIVGSESHRYAPGKFFSKKVGAGSFDISMLSPEHRAFVVAGSCASADFCTTEDVDVGTTVCQDFMTADFGGSVGWIGPTAGTWQRGNRMLVKYILEEMQSSVASRPVAESWLIAQQRYHDDFSNDPGLLATAESYVFLGDPVTPVRPVDVATSEPTANPPTPAHFALLPPVPNPARSSVEVAFDVPHAALARIAIFDVTGRLVRNLANQLVAPGRVRLKWDGVDSQGQHAAAGTYFVRPTAESLELTKKPPWFGNTGPRSTLPP
jgi:hypothetical protein